jgi:hypothetical protein
LLSPECRLNPAILQLFCAYDAKFDGDSIDEEVFKISEAEYNATIVEIKWQIRTLGEGNPSFYQDACRTLELSKRLFALVLQANYEELEPR